MNTLHYKEIDLLCIWIVHGLNSDSVEVHFSVTPFLPLPTVFEGASSGSFSLNGNRTFDNNIMRNPVSVKKFFILF